MKKELLKILKNSFSQSQDLPSNKTEWLRSSSNMIASSLVYTIASILDLLMVELFGKNETSVGYYAAILAIVSVIQLVSTNIYQEIKPKISTLIKSKDGKVLLQKNLDRINFIALPLIIAITSIIIFFSKPLLHHFGPTFINAKTALIILTLGSCFSALSVSSRLLLIYSGYERLVLKINLIETSLLLVLLIPATYYFNIIGTASATAFMMSTKLFTSIYFVRKKISMRSLIFY